MRQDTMLIPLFLVICCLPLCECITSQSDIDNIADNLQVNYVVKDNFLTYGIDFFLASLNLTNTGHDVIPGGDWRVYFTSVQMVEPEFLKSGGIYTDNVTRLSFAHENGYLFSFGPVQGFSGIKSGEKLQVTFKTSYWSVSRFDQMPNWYVSAPGREAKVLTSTEGELLDFVGKYTSPNQYKRFQNDQYMPWTPEMRFIRNQKNMYDQPLPSGPIIPTPAVYDVKGGKPLEISGEYLTVVYTNMELLQAAQFLKNGTKSLVLSVNLVLDTELPQQGKVIVLQTADLSEHSSSPDTYTVDVDGQSVYITGASTTGVFYGVMSLIQLLQTSQNLGYIPGCHIVDWPRFEYRGMMVDAARNFRPVDSVMKLLDVMAMYKLNKFHFHLTDDEGWRLEIPGLPELTQVGGQRCHDLTETKCVMSTLGSGPDSSTSGSGFYTVDEYKSIVRYAAERHIEVIPEIDMPGHAHSAIRAMKVRKSELLNSGKSAAEAGQFDLVDDDDTSSYLSIQFYKENAVNPCLNSSYRFIEKVLTELKQMHARIQPLKVYHFGGDEVAHGAWINSSACRQLLENGVNLKEEFTRRVSDLTRDLTLAGWEDGLMDHGNMPWNRSKLHNDDVLVYTWQNVWEWGGGARAHILANEGYKVVLSAATELYFDQPQEPSPEERGLYWATRFTDSRQTFAFMPDDYYMNVAIQRSGEAISLEQMCGEGNKGCPPLEKPENIVGMQGHLWSETVRTTSQFDYMVFPRLLALAERAWHKAEWEGKELLTRQYGLRQDWARFSQLLGSDHLAMLDKLGVKYRVPPPGARQLGNQIEYNTEFPGLQVQYQFRGLGHTQWMDAVSPIPAIEDGQKVAFRTTSADKSRYSREVVVTVARNHEDVHSGAVRKLLSSGWFGLLLVIIVAVSSRCGHRILRCSVS